MEGEDQAAAVRLRTASLAIIGAVNEIASMLRLSPPEMEAALSRCLLMAIASHAIAGREEHVLETIIRHLRASLPSAIEAVREERLRQMPPASRA